MATEKLSAAQRSKIRRLSQPKEHSPDEAGGELNIVPFLDIGVIFFWVPGVILFLFGYPLIFGWWSMLLLPITLGVFGFLQRWQARHVFRTLDVQPQSDKRGFVGYLLAYQVLMSAAALRGYGQSIVGSNRRWK